MGAQQGIASGTIYSLDPHLFILMGVEQLMATHSKNVKTSPPLNVYSPGYVLGHLSHVPITVFMSVGVASIAGMFTGRSTSMSAFASLSHPTALTTITGRIVEVTVGAT